MLKNRLWLWIIPVAVIGAVIASISAYPMFQSGDRLIIARYAEQFRAGNGLVFNPDQRVLLLPYPGYMLPLGILAAIFPTTDIRGLSTLLFFAALLLGAISLYRIVQRLELSPRAALLAAALYCLAWPILSSLGTPFPVASALCLLSLDLALSGKWSPAGFTIALSVLVHPQVLLLAIPLLMLALHENQGQRYALSMGAVLVLAGIGLTTYYGPSFSEGLLILKSVSTSRFDLLGAIFLIPVLLLAMWGWYRRRDNLLISLLGVWATLHLLIVGGLLHITDLASFAPLAGPLLITGFSGMPQAPKGRMYPLVRLKRAVGIAQRPVGQMYSFVRTAVLIGTKGAKYSPKLLYPVLTGSILLASMLGITIFKFLGTPDLPTLPAHSIGISTIGSLSWLPSPAQSIISFDGQLQPELKKMIERGDTQSVLIRYAPDVLIEFGSDRIGENDLSTDAFLRLDYRPAEDGPFYIRHAAIGQFIDHPATISYGPDIKLVGYAIDQTSLKPGQMMRVRLDWQFAHAASKPVQIDLRLASGDFLLAHVTDDYEPGIFLTGAWSTYHTISVIPQAWSGLVDLEIGVLVGGSPINHATVGRLMIE